MRVWLYASTLLMTTGVFTWSSRLLADNRDSRKGDTSYKDD